MYNVVSNVFFTEFKQVLHKFAKRYEELSNTSQNLLYPGSW